VSDEHTILYIDDDPDDREILHSVLSERKENIKLVEAENGLQGLKYLDTAKKSGMLPCLIILDLNMPLLDGRQTLIRIKQDVSLQKVPVIVYTSSYNPNDKSFFNRQGIDLITKPSNISFLRKIADQMLRYCTHSL
jgi:CheY-like chemotaxis protein